MRRLLLGPLSHQLSGIVTNVGWCRIAPECKCPSPRSFRTVARSMHLYDESWLRLRFMSPVLGGLSLSDPPERGGGRHAVCTEGHNRITSIAVGIPFVTLIDASVSAQVVSAAAGGASVFAFGDHDGPLPADVFTFSSPVTGLHVEAGLFLMAQPTIDAFFQASGFDLSFVQSESVPEPSIVLLLVSGAGLVAAMAHKIQQS